jgi:hypothetical protein
MNKEQFERLNALSEKAINDCLTPIELGSYGRFVRTGDNS